MILKIICCDVVPVVVIVAVVVVAPNFTAYLIEFKKAAWKLSNFSLFLSFGCLKSSTYSALLITEGLGLRESKERPEALQTVFEPHF